MLLTKLCQKIIPLFKYWYLVCINNHDPFHISDLLFKLFKMNYGQSFTEYKLAFIILTILLVA